MTAVVKKIGEKREKRAGFEVPTIKEIADFMKEKKRWPESFCEYYAEKFWNNYAASGWKLSNGNSMKSWQAAFMAQWQNIRYQVDIEYLNNCLKNKPVVQNKSDGWLNELLAKYKHNFESVAEETLIKAYDYMKQNRLIKLEKYEVNLLKASYGNNVEKGKAACVKMIFSKMVNYGKRF